MASNLCEHIEKFKSAQGILTYRIIHAYFVSCVSGTARKRKALETYCRSCQHRGSRIHACLKCAYFGCFDYGHIQEHAYNSNHDIAVDVNNGNIFCLKCGDYIYVEDFEDIAQYFKKQAGRITGCDSYIPWKPNLDEVSAIKACGGIKKITDNSWIGLRGLVNLGNTCFMNCIVQVLVHTPVLRDYFLSDKHICLKANPNTCVACEMFKIFQEFFSGNPEPYVPSELVYLIWQRAKHMIGSDQQDAHEFLVAILDAIHAHSKSGESDDKLYDPLCDCIVHKAFTGCYHSVLFCQQCNRVGTKNEYFFELSLDLGESLGGKNTANQDPVKLLDCLKRYTNPEILHNTPCSNCKSENTSVKQLTIRKLPLVACLHLKRLAPNSIRKACNKNSTHVMFPEFLDMSPFMSTNCLDQTVTEDSMDLTNSKNIFTLFAVVTHRGDQTGGHYISYIRQHRDKWFLCDDDTIVQCSLEDVLDSEGYILFYHKQVLEYGDNCIPINETVDQS
ncbi:ubiquitin carboxyl-terminal hydrolase 22 [Trichonephila clavata]|uniref:Ubiquitin carboxyl-terminal hydrolase n=1 Tax=Trichonephila clavata TaxID=2740835 RepID=A0A8X6HX40_TRICU|nr:ubiquitin carboxyl-terminal hydrolase 22 [Trichonephila clavata]